MNTKKKRTRVYARQPDLANELVKLNMSYPDMAEAIGVSTATVGRFMDRVTQHSFHADIRRKLTDYLRKSKLESRFEKTFEIISPEEFEAHGPGPIPLVARASASQDPVAAGVEAA